MKNYNETNRGTTLTEQSLSDTIQAANSAEVEVLDYPTNPRLSRHQEIAEKLAQIRTAEGRPKYGMIGDKPVIFNAVVTVLTDQSEKFQDKLLCDGLVLNAGDACVFSCTFCYVPAAMLKLHARLMEEFNRETGLNLDLSQVVIRRRGFLEVLKSQLLHEDGTRRYGDPDDRRVVYSSTLVDVAGNMEILRETASACLLILENTNWEIRLLSKSSLLALLVTKEMIPAKFHSRLILGFSTGTLDNDLADAIEGGTGLVSKRIAALRELQDLGIRTFGMICPSLPYGSQEEYDEFSRRICEAIRVDKCEHVWAEVINLRGDSQTATVKALREAGFEAEAKRLETVSGPGSKKVWEQYARMTFEAHAKNIPTGKFRFLQYVNANTADCWACERANGAVLLGSYAERNNLITIGTSAPSVPFPELKEADLRYREEREEIVTATLKGGLAAAEALYEIHSYRDGILWRKEFRTFEKYCQVRWDYQKSHAYRLVRTGGLTARLKADGCPVGHNLIESHLRPVLSKVPEDHRVECLKSIISTTPEEKLTATTIAAGVKKYLKNHGIETKASKRPKQDAGKCAKLELDKLKAVLGKLPVPDRFGPLLDGISMLIDQVPEADAGDAIGVATGAEPEQALVAT